MSRIFIALGFALVCLALISLLSGMNASAATLAELDDMELVPAAERSMAKPGSNFERSLTSPLESPAELAAAQATDPVEALPKHGSLLGRVSIPTRQIDAPIRHGANERVLKASAGHVPGTALPGSALGNIVLAAHRDSLFSNLRHVQEGDVVTVESVVGPQQKVRRLYQVTGMRVVDETDLSVLDSSTDEILTLMTCFPFDFIGPAPQRFIVTAIPFDQPEAGTEYRLADSKAATPTI